MRNLLHASALLSLLTSAAAALADEVSETLKVVERGEHADGTDAFHILDFGEPGPSPGDIETYAKEIYDETNTTQIGTEQGWCIRTVPFVAWECTWSIFLPDGQISAQGPFYDKADRDATLAVTGGTGKYAYARGEVKIHSRGTSLDYDLTYTLRY
jgi:allene oxide cyclase